MQLLLPQASIAATSADDALAPWPAPTAEWSDGEYASAPKMPKGRAGVGGGTGTGAVPDGEIAGDELGLTEVVIVVDGLDGADMDGVAVPIAPLSAQRGTCTC